MRRTVSHTCCCGTIQTAIHVPVASAGTRLRCYCGDCQTAACLHNRGEDTLAPVGASDIWQTTPDRMEFLTGKEYLKIYRLSPRGGYRWFATCCGTLMFSTLKNLKVPFVSIPLRQSEVAVADQVLGPVRCHAFTESARPGPDAPLKSSGMYRVLLLALKRAGMARITGRGRKNPLYTGDGDPIAQVEVITLERRRAIMPDHLRPKS